MFAKFVVSELMPNVGGMHKNAERLLAFIYDDYAHDGLWESSINIFDLWMELFSSIYIHKYSIGPP